MNDEHRRTLLVTIYSEMVFGKLKASDDLVGAIQATIDDLEDCKFAHYSVGMFNMRLGVSGTVLILGVYKSRKKEKSGE